MLSQFIGWVTWASDQNVYLIILTETMQRNEEKHDWLDSNRIE